MRILKRLMLMHYHHKDLKFQKLKYKELIRLIQAIIF